MFVTIVAATAVAAPDVEVSGSAALGYLQYDDLWVGDPVLGGFDGASSAFLANRFLLTLAARGTLWVGDQHRFRLSLDSRSLRRVTVLREDGSLGAEIISDGLPLGRAALERGFVEEGSWRWRPRGDRGVDLRVGMLPYAISAGRFLAESWPGARLQVDGGPLGGPPVVADLRGAVRTDGSVQAALTVRREWSAFERVGIEVAGLWDTRGVAPVIEDDPGLLLGTFGRANEPFLDDNAADLEAWLYETYLADDYGVDRFVADAGSFLDLGGRATMGYGSVLGAGLVGPVWIDAVAVLAVGTGTLSGERVPPGAAWVTPPEDWVEVAPSETWSHRWRSLAGAWDVAIEVPGRPVGVFGFFQGATGDEDLVETSDEGGVVRAFIAPDQRLLRTRVFPVDAAARGGAWSLPPGVGGYGLVSVGAGVRLAGDLGGIKVQGARPWSWVGSCVGCADGETPRRAYGAEADALGWLELGPLRPSADVGAFVPGAFFVDRSDPDRDEASDLPVGWRVFVGVGVAL